MIRPPLQQRGLTLVESLLASAILSFAASAMYMSITASQTQFHYAAHARRGMKLAEELLQYVTVLPYSDPDGASNPGPESGESGVAGFDNIDDFHGYSESAGSLTDVAGNAYPAAHQLFSRSVTVQYGSQNISQLGGAIPGLTVNVTVTNSKGQSWSLSRFVAEPAT